MILIAKNNYLLGLSMYNIGEFSLTLIGLRFTYEKDFNICGRR